MLGSVSSWFANAVVGEGEGRIGRPFPIRSCLVTTVIGVAKRAGLMITLAALVAAFIATVVLLSWVCGIGWRLTQYFYLTF